MKDDPILSAKVQTLLGERGQQPDHAVRFRDLASLTDQLRNVAGEAGREAAQSLTGNSTGSATTAQQLAAQVAELREAADAASERARRAAFVAQQIREELDALTEGFAGDVTRLVERISNESAQNLATVRAQVQSDVSNLNSIVTADLNSLTTKVDLDAMRIWRSEDAITSIYDRLTGLQAWQFGTEKRLIDAGIRVDPASGTVRIAGIDAMSDRVSLTEISLNAVQSEIGLKASVTYVNETVSNALLDPTNIPIVEELTLRISSAEVALNGALASIELKANLLTVEDMEVRLQSAEVDIDALESAITLRVTQSEFEGVTSRLDAAEISLSALDAPTITATVQASRRVLADVDAANLGDLHALLQAHMDGVTERESIAIAQSQIRAYVEEGILAEASARTTLAAALDGAVGSLQQEMKLRIDTEAAVAAQITTLNTAMDGFTADLSANYYTRTDADIAIAAATTELKAELEGPEGSIGTLTATLNDDYYTAVETDSAISFATTALDTALRNPDGQIKATLLTGFYTRSEADTAISNASTSLRSAITRTAPVHGFGGGAADWTSSNVLAPEAAANLNTAWTVAGGKASITIGAANTNPLRARGVHPVREGERMRITVRARVVGGSGGTAGLQVQFVWIAGNEAWSSVSSQTNNLDLIAGAGWITHVVERNAPAGAGYLRPGLLFRGAQYAGGPVGEVEILRAESVAAASEVLATLTSDYYTITGADTAISNAVTEYNTSIRLPDGQIRGTILSNYYTKSGTDDAIAGQIQTFESQYFTTGGQVKATALTSYITTASANDAISASANTLNASINSVADSIQGFQRTMDALSVVTVGNAVTVALGGAALGQAATLIISEGATARSFSGFTNGASVQIPSTRALLFAGQRVKIGVLARRPATNAATRFGVAYSTNDNGNSGYIQSSQDLTTAWAWHVFHATIPQAVAGGPGYLGIYGDNSKTGKATEIAKVFIEIASVAGELPEINTLSGQVTDIRGLNLSQLTGTAFGALLTQLNVQADGTSATVTTQGSAIATLQSGASAGYLIKAQAGGAVSLLDLIAADGSSGTVSVARLKADDILLDGSVAARQLVITEFDGNSVPNGRFLRGDLRGWSNIPTTFALAARSAATDPGGQSAPTDFYLRITTSSALQTATMAEKVAAKPGDRFHVRFAYATEGSGTRSVGMRVLLDWYDAAGALISTSNVGVFGASATAWANFAEDVTAPAGAASVNLFLRRGNGGSGFGLVTNIEVTRQRDGRTFLTPNSITTNQIDTVDFNAAGLAVFGGTLQSSNYVAGANGAGWKIDNAGNAEFGTLALREGAVSATQAVEVAGPLSSSSTAWVTIASMVVTPTSNRPFIVWYSGAFTAQGQYSEPGPGEPSYLSGYANSSEYRLLWRGATIRQRFVAGPDRGLLVHLSDVKLVTPGGTTAGTLELQFRRGNGTSGSTGTVTASEATLVVTELKR
jgi:hypothetical protein